VTDHLRVVRGDASDEELAALVAALSVVAAREAARAEAAAKRRTPSLWARPGRNIHTPLEPGPGAWRASASPR
jgi:Acyl-CoA carboxylase epsilon subunit